MSYKELITTEQNKSIEFISCIDDLWILNQLYRFIVNMTKGTQYEGIADMEGSAK